MSERIKDYMKKKADWESEPETMYIATRLTDRLGRPARTLINGGIAIREGIEVAKLGHYPFIPSLDYMMYMQMNHGDLDQLGEQYYYGYSINFLDKCDSMYIANGLEDSHGVQREENHALKTGKKMYYHFEDIPKVKPRRFE